jgi:CheY-like chemotaxis protein
LPLSGGKLQKTAGTAVDSNATVTPCTGLRLLVVDDNKDAAISLAMLLRINGHEVQIAHDGPTALEAAMSFKPDVVFLDIGMPGMDGFEVASRLKQNAALKNVILVALTGWGQPEDRQRTQATGFHYHFVKPVEPAALHGLLTSLNAQRNQ